MTASVSRNARPHRGGRGQGALPHPARAARQRRPADRQPPLVVPARGADNNSTPAKPRRPRGRPPLGDRAMSGSERQRRRRAKLGTERSPAIDGLIVSLAAAAAMVKITRPWCGTVWLNPPYSRPLIAQFVHKLCEEFCAGRVSAAVMATNNFSDTIWFHKAARVASTICFTRGRYPLSGASRFRGSDHNVDVYVFGRDETPFVAEVKGRKSGTGFVQLERWLGEFGILFLRRNHRDPLIALPWGTWVRLLESIRR
jgi:hypothetical protein